MLAASQFGLSNKDGYPIAQAVVRKEDKMVAISAGADSQI